MLPILPAVCTALMLQAPALAVETRFVQVAPAPTDGKPARSEGQKRAVVLIHGFLMHFRSSSVPQPRFRDWQRPECRVVKRLAKEADVFAFAYGQNASLDEVVKHSGLDAAVAGLRRLGYEEIVLVGHSAGGLIARQFVEDNPDAGVTRVIAVCAPNDGTPAADYKVHKTQQAFLDSLTAKGRKAALKARADRRIPRGVEFVCLLATGDGTSDTDGVVPCRSQWPEDLRKQGIPVVALGLNHREPMRTAGGAEVLARLVREKQPRWEDARVATTVKELFKKQP